MATNTGAAVFIWGGFSCSLWIEEEVNKTGRAKMRGFLFGKVNF